MEVGLLTIRSILAVVFLTAGLAKITDLRGTRGTLEQFGLPPSMSGAFSVVLPVIEIAVGLLLFSIQSSWFGAIGGAGLLVIFTAAMGYQLLNGNAPDCRCFGQIHSRPVGWPSIIRNLLFLLLELHIFVTGKKNRGWSLYRVQKSIGADNAAILVSGLSIVVIVMLVLVLVRQQEVLRRLETAELMARDGIAVERDGIGHPNDGLPIGGLFPDFELSDLAGNSVTLMRLLDAGKPLLFLFVSPTCEPCKALLPEFDTWQAELEDKLRFVLISTGDARKNREKLGGDKWTILLQRDRELADLVGARWTPTAMVVNTDGRVLSHTAAGDVAIRELIAKLKNADLGSKYQYFANGRSDVHTLRIGDVIPDLSVTDVDGDVIDTDHFRGQPTLLAFWSSTCPHCMTMMDDLREWEKTKDDRAPNLTVFSDSSGALQGLDLMSRVIVDEHYHTAALFGMRSTPSAVLIDENGRFASETAIGERAIWSLVGRQK